MRRLRIRTGWPAVDPRSGRRAAVRTAVGWTGGMVVALLLVGCGQPVGGATSDCNLDLTFQGHVYLGVNMGDPVPAVQPLGIGTGLDCVDIPVSPDLEPSTYDVEVSQVVGAHAEDAVASGQVLYVRVEVDEPPRDRAARVEARAVEIMADALDGNAAGAAASEAPTVAEGGSCVEVMTAETLAGRAFGFDGTVVSAVPAAEVDGDAGDLPAYVTAQFEVEEWFAGGAGASVTVKMQREVTTGERLLVSGEPLFGGDPLNDPIAWECGFTVEHDDATAETWRTAW